MHSYADRYTHDFFFERDYPDVAILEGIFVLLQSQPVEKRELQKRMLMDPEVFDRALEKLWTHGGAVVDFAENVSRGHDAWRQPYLAQGAHKREQIERMIRYAESNQCRMAEVVRHFGDLADSEKPCGICDYCAPAHCTAQRFRTATAAEHAALLRVVAELRAAGARSTGRIYAELFPHHEMTRDDFEDLLGGMARAGIVRLDDAVFEKNGRQIPYRTARLTVAGAKLDARTPLDLVMKDREPSETPPKRRKKAGAGGVGPQPIAAGSAKRPKRPPDAPPDLAVEEALRAWRLAEARRLGVPAFRIFTDRALSGLVSLRPGTSSEMLSVPGIGLRIAEKYGSEICRILRR
jgi:superfamily II DNA helicase RecQ